MRSHGVRAVVCGLVLLAACDDGPTGPRVVEGEGQLTAPRAEARFEVQAQATGSFRPGQPVQITVKGRSRLRTADAEVRLVLPELAALRAGGGQRMKLEVGHEVQPEISVRQATGRGQSLNRTANVTFDRPGYYQVIASIVQRSDDAADEQPSSGDPASGTAHDIIWLWIAESGGRVTDDFEEARFPAGVHVAPGPLTPETEPMPGSSERAPGEGTGTRPAGLRASHAPIAGWVDIHAAYANPDAGGTATPIPNARYEFYIYTASGAYVEMRPGTTGSDGLAFTQCYKDAAGTYGSYRLRVFLDNTRLVMNVPMAIDATGWFSSQCGTVTTAQTTTEAQKMSAHVYTNLDRDIRYSDSYFGVQRPRITVRVEPAAYSTYEWNTTKNLVIDTSIDTNYPSSQVWGEYGQFVQAHEYGHALHEESLGGAKRYYVNCPEPHGPGDPTTLGCALAEGFPDYYAVTVAGAYTPGWRSRIESNYYLPATTSPNGAIYEGAVAAFLYDITDSGTTEAHDQTAYPGSYVATIVRTCEAYNGAWAFNSGVDHLAHCFMGSVTDAAQFGRTPAPTAVREGATEPEANPTRATKIRKNYQKNLFNRVV
ncbi:hypothetical protein [Longimicrobium sp.]|uniref:hypothetical protein n=1 Tax=Longimicrobium sp. TaxID=2029185 RepID=UPI003B3B32B6